MLLRNSMLTNILTYNLEVTAKLTKRDIKVLDEVDLKLLRDSLNLSSKCSRSLIHAELGIISIEQIIKQKRILYLHHLLSSDDENLAKIVLLQQIKKATRNDWINVVKSDLRDFNLNVSFDQISEMSKLNFKKIVKEAARKDYFEQLTKDQRNLSKGKGLKYDKLSLQPYLKSVSELSSETMKKIIKIRLRDIYLKCNFPGAFGDRFCVADPKCKKEDSNEHLFSCEYLTLGNEISTTNITYAEIFNDDTYVQEQVANIMYTRLKKRNEIINPTGKGPADPRKKSNPSLGIKEARRKHTKSKNNT